jgi:CPA2 family monovalent cation:H+ antiporter-2
VAVSALTTLSTPWLIRASDPLARFVDRKLPKPLQTFAALYGSWLEGLSSARRQQTLGGSLRRLGGLLILDAVVLASLTIATSLSAATLSAALSDRFGIARPTATAVVVAAAVALSLPFCIGILRVTRRLAEELARSVLPDQGEASLDLAAAPRRTLGVTLQVAMVLLVGAPLVAATQPFLHGFSGAIVLVAVLAVLALAFWRSATNLEGHVRAGTQVLVEALAARSRGRPAERGANGLEKVHSLLPGLGDPIPVELDATSPAVGQTLADLNLRGLTGATVLVLTRGGDGARIPSAHEPLRAGDVLALAGTHEAIEAARVLLIVGSPGDDAAAGDVAP